MRLNVVGFLFLLRLGLLAAPVEDLRLSNAEGGWDAMYKEEIGPLAGFDSLPISTNPFQLRFAVQNDITHLAQAWLVQVVASLRHPPSSPATVFLVH